LNIQASWCGAYRAIGPSQGRGASPGNKQRSGYGEGSAKDQVSSRGNIEGWRTGYAHVEIDGLNIRAVVGDPAREGDVASPDQVGGGIRIKEESGEGGARREAISQRGNRAVGELQDRPHRCRASPIDQIGPLSVGWTRYPGIRTGGRGRKKS